MFSTLCGTVYTMTWFFYGDMREIHLGLFVDILQYMVIFCNAQASYDLKRIECARAMITCGEYLQTARQHLTLTVYLKISMYL